MHSAYADGVVKMLPGWCFPAQETYKYDLAEPLPAIKAKQHACSTAPLGAGSFWKRIPDMC